MGIGDDGFWDLEMSGFGNLGFGIWELGFSIFDSGMWDFWILDLGASDFYCGSSYFGPSDSWILGFGIFVGFMKIRIWNF